MSSPRTSFCTRITSYLNAFSRSRSTPETRDPQIEESSHFQSEGHHFMVQLSPFKNGNESIETDEKKSVPQPEATTPLMVTRQSQTSCSLKNEFTTVLSGGMSVGVSVFCTFFGEGIYHGENHEIGGDPRNCHSEGNQLYCLDRAPNHKIPIIISAMCTTIGTLAQIAISHKNGEASNWALKSVRLVGATAISAVVAYQITSLDRNLEDRILPWNPWGDNDGKEYSLYYMYTAAAVGPAAGFLADVVINSSYRIYTFVRNSAQARTLDSEQGAV